MQNRDKQGKRDEEAAAGWRRVGRNFVPRSSGVGERKRADAFPDGNCQSAGADEAAKMQKRRDRGRHFGCGGDAMMKLALCWHIPGRGQKGSEASDW